MNIYLKSAVQNLDAHITALQEIRNQLASGIDAPVMGVEVFRPGQPLPAGAPVQTLEPGNGARVSSDVALAMGSGKRLRKTTRKANGGGRRVRTEGRGRKSEGGATRAALTAMSAKMLRAGHNAEEPFGTSDIENLAGCTKKQASNAITRWLINGFIKRVDTGKYRRLAKFSGAKETVVEVSRPPSPRPSPSGEGERAPATVAVAHALPAKTAPKETRSAAAEPTAADNGASRQQRPTDAGGTPALPGEGKLTPYSPSGIAIGAKLKTVFTMEELAGLLPQGKQQAYYFVSQWRNKDWITKEDFDIYRKSAGFGT